MTLSADSSRLKLGVKMNSLRAGQSAQMIGQNFTAGCEEPTSCPPYGGRGGQSSGIPLGSSLQFEVTNAETQPLYLGILLVDPSEGVVVLFPNDYPQLPDQDRDLSTQIEAGKTRLIPDPSKKEFVLTLEEAGFGEMLIIASESP
ncbi:MAG: DUF4384 domain-containing protein [Coleofasciculaceae cyanobacterium]